MTDLATTRDLLGDLIALPTVSADSNLEMIALLANRLGDLGAEVEILADQTGTKANLLARIGPEEPGGVLLSGHSDVVPVEDQDWTSDPFVMREAGGKLFGRGTCDMKGFIAAAVAMADRFAAQDLRHPVSFAFTYDEEVGCLGARGLRDVLQDRELIPSLAIIGEPTEMRIIEGHKGCCEYTTRFTGLEGHGSRPELGVNAVEYAVRYVSQLLELREHLRHRAPPGSAFEPPWSTINIGRLTGGHVHNVIPGLAEVDWEMRPVQDRDRDYVKGEIDHFVRQKLLPEMRRVHPDADVVTEVIGEVAGLIPMDDNGARDLVARLTRANGTDLVSFGTEAGLFQQLGMSAVICGPGSISQAHKPDEFIELEQLDHCLSMLHGLADQLAA
ncbi:acetylornithine deacetylase [Pseudooceanicola batsensis HTCC2597]|uniref:Acetylornithine deacetylase n=1 Tax=Pseudooceanicola batsensis (strain ATCC BAA-863 / DSM 15984 / KCTC 12145 / HTCC2597) TaxID=252305 RepID=A3TWB4_PSEBH|nr:acetylornithine deacetylase [Pseudooceanicola batsensis]EAQ03910.1 acetylornithine deacetylase [Pseudooceanicola batsensis HTCC2597]